MSARCLECDDGGGGAGADGDAGAWTEGLACNDVFGSGVRGDGLGTDCDGTGLEGWCGWVHERDGYGGGADDKCRLRPGSLKREHGCGCSSADRDRGAGAEGLALDDVLRGGIGSNGLGANGNWTKWRVRGCDGHERESYGRGADDKLGLGVGGLKSQKCWVGTCSKSDGKARREGLARDDVL